MEGFGGVWGGGVLEGFGGVLEGFLGWFWRVLGGGFLGGSSGLGFCVLSRV